MNWNSFIIRFVRSNNCSDPTVYWIPTQKGVQKFLNLFKRIRQNVNANGSDSYFNLELDIKKDALAWWFLLSASIDNDDDSRNFHLLLFYVSSNQKRYSRANKWMICGSCMPISHSRFIIIVVVAVVVATAANECHNNFKEQIKCIIFFSSLHYNTLF